jgi:hypothetical protein
MSIAQRATAKAIYQRWFYAPHWTGRRCAERLRALGFVWDGAHWHMPTEARFLEGLKQ